jgi:hypothetical protein
MIFTRHPTPRTTCPIHRGNTTTVSETRLTIAVGSAKAQGSKAKPINGPEPSRATRVRDETIQRITNILAHLVPHRRDPASSSFVSESRPRESIQLRMLKILIIFQLQSQRRKYYMGLICATMKTRLMLRLVF